MAKFLQSTVLIAILLQIVKNSSSAIPAARNQFTEHDSFESLEEILIEQTNRRKSRAAIHTDASEARAIVDAETQTANKFVDFALVTFGNVLKSQDGGQVLLPETTKQIDKKFLGIPFRAFAHFYDGTIKGLESIHRKGDAQMIETRADHALALAFDVELNDIEFKYAYNVSLYKIGPGGRVAWKLKSILIHLKLTMSQEGELIVDQLDIKDTGTFAMHTSGLGPFNFIFSGLGMAVGNLGKRLVLESMEEKLRVIMNEALADVTTAHQKKGLSIMMKALLIRKRAPPSTRRVVESLPSDSDNSFESSGNRRKKRTN